MPRQNRVTPWGTIIATPERGTLLGNRGCLHDDRQHIVREWQRKAWVTCLLEFKGRRRAVMSPGRYTELFFLDEATALAAGHRPCGTCRRDRFRQFIELWIDANPALFHSRRGRTTAIDDVLHAERVDEHGRKRIHSARTGDLPVGAMVAVPGENRPLLVGEGSVFEWHPSGYRPGPARLPRGTPVAVLTPSSVVNVLRAGYRPLLHPSAGSR